MFSPAALALRITSSVTKAVVAMPVTSVSAPPVLNVSR